MSQTTVTKEVAAAEPVILQSSDEDASAARETEPYSVYTKREKWFIVAMVAVAGFYSPLPANIYLPAIPTLSVKFGVTTEVVNQSVTAFVIAQGICEFVVLS